MQETYDRLREMFPPGATVTTVIRHVSRSGCTWSISVLWVEPDTQMIYDVSGQVADVLGDRFDDKRGGVVLHGGGMDMAFHLVNSLSKALYPNGFGCLGENCPSNEHIGRQFRGTHHADLSGYALRYRGI